MAETEQIEKRIDRDVAGGIVIAGNKGAALTIVPQTVSELLEFSKLMSVAGACVGVAFRGNPGACLAITIQSMKWGADPFAVSNKAYITKDRSGNERISYEAQLVHAIVNTCAPLERRLRPTYSGDGKTRKCKIEGWLRGEDKPLEYESPTIENIAVKNSPLWSADKDQQLFYYSTRAWARRHVPEVLLGIYTPDEIQNSTIIDATPPFPEVAQPQEPERLAAPESKTVTAWSAVDHNGEVREMPTRAKAIEAVEKILEARAKHGLEALDAAWNNNDVLIVELRDAGYGDESDGLEALYRDLREPFVQGDSEPSDQDFPDQQAPEDNAVLSDQDRVMLEDNIEQETPETPESSIPETAATAEEETIAPDHEPVQQEVLPPTEPRSRQSRDRHDPFWDGRSLSISPPPGKGRGVLDWKLWPVLVHQRIRQAWTKETIDTLYLHNEHNFIPYAQARGERDCSELKDEFTNARAGLPFAADL